MLERASPRDIPREVVLVVTARGRLLTEYATVVFHEVEEELTAFIGRDVRASLALISEAARALGVPGTAADF